MSGVEAVLGWSGSAELGEGPVWDSATGSLLWVDLWRATIFRGGSRPDRAVDVVHQGDDVITTALVPRHEGGFAVCTATAVELYDREWTRQRRIGVTDGSRYRLSDATATPTGDLLVGLVDAGASGTPGSIVRVTSDGDIAATGIDALGFANGMGFSPSGDVLHVVDSTARAIRRYRYDVETGEIGARSEDVDTAAVPGLPDGLVVDTAGDLLVAFFGGGRVCRWDGTRWSVEVLIPTDNPTSCAFIGRQCDEIAITTARVELSEAALARQPLAGSVLLAPVHNVGQLERRCAIESKERTRS